MSTRGFDGIVKQAQRMQQQIAKVHDEFKDRQIEASAGGGMVIAKVDGSQRLTGITIDPEVVDPEDIETLQDLIQAAVNLALENASEMMQSEVNKITGGLNMPGMF